MGQSTPLQGVGEYSVASDYLVGLVSVATTHGLSVDECLMDSGLTPQILLRAPHRIGNLSMRIVTDNILKNLPLESLVAEYLDHIGNFSHGPLSLVLQSSANLAEALSAISLFSDTRSEGNVFGYRDLNSHFSLELVSFAEYQDNRVNVDKFICLSTLLITAKGLAKLIEPKANLGELSFAFPVERPNLLQAKVPNYNVKFGQESNLIRFHKNLAFSPVIKDRSVYRDAFRECEAARNISSNSNEIVARVRFELSKNPGQNLTIVDVASALCMCPRSLQRKLTSSGHGFRTIKSEEQFKRAKYYLENTLMSVENIASELGYSHPSNFIKNFKAESNLSPSKYRESKLR